MKPVLIVEDDFEIRSTLCDVLSSEGYNVLGAENGKAALELLNKTENLPGLIIVDLMMPIMDGYEFRNKQLKDKRIASVPTVLFSADGQLINKAQAAGISEFIKKPIDLDDLYSLVKKYCD